MPPRLVNCKIQSLLINYLAGHRVKAVGQVINLLELVVWCVRCLLCWYYWRLSVFFEATTGRDRTVRAINNSQRKPVKNPIKSSKLPWLQGTNQLNNYKEWTFRIDHHWLWFNHGYSEERALMERSRVILVYIITRIT